MNTINKSKKMKQGYSYLKAGILFLLFSFSSTLIYSQQYFVNSEWMVTVGNDTSQYLYKKATVKVDQYKNVYTLGSTITTTGHDFLLMKQNGSGDTLYITQWGGDGDGEDIAMDMWINNGDEYVYVVGGSIQDSTGADSLDAVIVAFDNTGTELWHSYQSGTNSYNDIYTSITTDGSGYLYAAGTTGTGSSAGYDFLLNGFDFSGTEIFLTTYDYANYDDVAVKVVFDGKLWVAGASQPNDTTWDYCLVAYDENGGYGGEYRNYAGTGVTHRPTDAVFSNNRYYVTGAVRSVGTDYDIKTICLDTALTVIWEQTWDGTDGMDDVSNSIKVDGDGNVYITGRTGTNAWTSDMVTIKYDSTGNEQWVKIFGEFNNTNEAAFDLELYNDNVFIAGYTDGGTNYCTIAYDTAGVFRWVNLSDIGGTPHPIDMATDIDGNVIIAAPLLYLLYTEKLSYYNRIDIAVTDTAGTPLRLENQILVKFNPEVVKQSAVDRKGKVFGTAKEFLQDSTITKLSTIFGFDVSNGDSVTFIKVYKNLTTADSISIGRSGDSVDVPAFWSMLLMVLPSSVTIDSILFDTLETAWPDVYYAKTNRLFVLHTNDPEYNEQECLYPTSSYPNGHINMQPAWAYEEGNSIVKIGVYDSGINYNHEDFIGTCTYGWDYLTDCPMNYSPYGPDDFFHGSACAGLIGAIRNNSKGIAGIAGGNDSAGIDGVTLCPFKIYDADNQWIGEDDIYESWLEGASSFAFNLNAMSLSWGQPGLYEYAMHEIMRYVNNSDVSMIISRGNRTDGSSTWVDEPIYPACVKDPFAISVGSSGTNGDLKELTNCDSSFLVQDQFNLSIFGRGMDIIAPGTSALVRTTINTPNNGYAYFSGTSAAAPIVAGVVGLMQSNYDGELMPEDVEYLIERFATDKRTPGYDDTTGWGLINAGAIMDSIHRPQFDVLHFNYSSQPTTTYTSSVSGINDWFFFDDQFFGYDDDGQYLGHWYRADVKIYHDLPAGASIIDAWPRNSDSKGWAPGTHFGTAHDWYDNHVYLDSVTPTYVKMHTYFTWLESWYYSGSAWLPVQEWVPCNPNVLSNRQFAYSLYVTNPTVSIPEEITDMSMNVFPNPSNEHVNILFKFDSERAVGFKLYDMTGRILLSTNETNYPEGENTFQINVSGLSAGLYVLQMNSGNKHIQKKIIVN